MIASILLSSTMISMESIALSPILIFIFTGYHDVNSGLSPYYPYHHELTISWFLITLCSIFSPWFDNSMDASICQPTVNKLREEPWARSSPFSTPTPPSAAFPSLTWSSENSGETEGNHGGKSGEMWELGPGKHLGNIWKIPGTKMFRFWQWNRE